MKPVEEMNEYERREWDEAKVACDHLARFVNSTADRNAYFAEHFVREHRTLQQNMIRLFTAVIERMAMLSSHQTDLRNEAAVRLCRKILAAMGDRYDRGLPYV